MGKPKKRKTPTQPSPPATASAVPARAAALVGLFILCGVVVAIKIHNTTSLPFYDRTNDENFYWTESAFHYRHFLMVAGGNSIPPNDPHIQYPEGADIRRHVTPVMENFYGRIHRWFFGDVPPHHFLVHATALFSTLSVIACFLAARSLSQSYWLALLSAALYGLALGSLYRNTSGFVREEFALPFLFGSFACYITCARKHRDSVMYLGAAFLLVAVAAWHVSQFYYQLFVVGVVITALVHGLGGIPQRCFTTYAVTMAVASLALPVLRAKFYAISMPMLVSYGLLFFIWLQPEARGWSRKKTNTLLVGLLVVLAVVAVVAQSATGSHSHVFAVLVAKVRNFGILPTDPQALSFEAKVMWTSAFVHLTWIDLVTLFSSTLAFGICGLLAIARSHVLRRATSELTLLLYFALVTLTLAIMFKRLTVLAVFFVALLAVYAWPRQHRGLQWAFGLLLVGCFYFEIGKFVGFGNVPRIVAQPARPSPEVLSPLTRYFRDQTPADASVLAVFQLSPSIAAFGQRPVLIQPKFESPALRNKIHEIYAALLKPEEEFYAVCEKYQARYLVYQSNMASQVGQGTLAYMVGRSDIPTKSVAFACQFSPESLRHLELVWQSARYRIFKIVEGPIGARAPLPYLAVYDAKMFWEQTPGPVISAEEFDQGWERMRRISRLAAEGRRLMKQNRVDKATEKYTEALKLHGSFPQARLGMVDVYSRAGRIAQAAVELAAALRIDPSLAPALSPQQSVTVPYTLALARFKLGQLEEAEQLLREVIRRKPGAWQPVMHLGLVLETQSETSAAEASYRKALEFNPRAYPALNALARMYLDGDDPEKARPLIEASLGIRPNQPQLLEAIKQLKKQDAPIEVPPSALPSSSP